jgi:hypothetical protein
MTKKMQLFALFICIQSALHVPGDFFTHHHEHLTVFTASDIVHLCCCRPVSWNEMEISFHLVHDTGLQQHRWTISEAVNTVKCSWRWAKISPETRRANWVQINQEVASCWSSITNYTNDARTQKHQNYTRHVGSVSFLWSCGLSFTVDLQCVL